MVFKLVLIAFLIYVAYRLFAGPPSLPGGRRKHIHEQEDDDHDYADYEEID